MKSTIMAVLTILMAIVAPVAMALTIYYLIQGFTKKDNKLKKKALIIFVGACIILLVSSMIEFLILANL